MQEEFNKKFPKLKEKNKLLYNSLDLEKARTLEINMKEKNFLISIGRLSFEKRFDILIKAIELLKKLEIQIKKLNLINNIYILGFKENPYP